MKEEQEAARRQERQRLETELELSMAAQEKLPSHDFTGMSMNTRAFGRVTIQRQEGSYLYFQAAGKERKFALPGCVVQGFLIPDDPQVTADVQAAEALRQRIEELRRLLDAPEAAADGEPYQERAQDLFDGTEDCHLAHCISADFNMGRGIVTQFNKRFGLGRKLRAAYPDYLAEWQKSACAKRLVCTGAVFKKAQLRHGD